MRKILFLAGSILILGAPVISQPRSAEKAVVETVKRFYDGFDKGTFPRAEEYTTRDWVHINPFGGRTVGREATLKDVRAVHATFLKGVTDTPEDFEVKFASPTVAIVIVPSRLSTFTAPDGVKFENQRCVRTFVVVKSSGRWLIMHDHNTFRS